MKLTFSAIEMKLVNFLSVDKKNFQNFFSKKFKNHQSNFCCCIKGEGNVRKDVIYHDL